MQWQPAAKLREQFLSYFEEKGSRRYPSFSLVPDDPTLLFTIAGMVPFKPYFLGLKTPEVTRATTAQKCVRTNDIDNVGRTARHHTFFEMLGNFSFGDYFKAEVIPWAWTFLTERVGLDPNRMYATVYRDDDEAADIWRNSVGLAADRVIRLGEEDNFWAAGPVGPCGPCSELLYDQGPAFSCGSPDCAPGCSCDRYLEIWNLVFMQFNRDEAGVLTPLPKKNIDTGMGLERLSSVVQQVKSDFETDLFRPLVDKACSLAGVSYGAGPGSDLAVRVIADHLRATAFMIADGILPSNEGTGYVLRRLLRRAVRFGRLLDLREPFLLELLPQVEATLADPYQELVRYRSTIAQVVDLEERRFGRTLEQGSDLLEQEIGCTKRSGGKELSGEVAFELYDTYGFPVELTEEMCSEAGLSVDQKGFAQAMERQKERARASSKQTCATMGSNAYTELADRQGPTVFLGYETEEARGTVLALLRDGVLLDRAEEGETAEVVLDRTPFYAERGGQVGDQGALSGEGLEAEVEDTIHPCGDLVAHRVRVHRGTLLTGATLEARVDGARRGDIRRHHTTTHLLHEALTQVLGDHVRQAGSLVSPEGLRFDYNHFAPLTPEQIQEVEDRVNEQVLKNLPVTTRETDLETAKALGAKALFEEKYGERVRVVSVEGYSTELCGGTHVCATGEIGLVKVHKDEGIGAGLRRIQATSGRASLRWTQEVSTVLRDVTSLLTVDPDALCEKTASLLEEHKALERKWRQALLQTELMRLDAVVMGRKRVGDVEVVISFYEDLDTDLLRQIGDQVKGRFPSSVSVLATKNAEKFLVVIMATDEAVAKGVHAGKLAKSLGALLGCNGGGKPQMAQVGGKFTTPLKGPLESVPQLVAEQMKG